MSAFHDLGFRTRDGSPETLLMLADVFLGNSVKRNRAYADRELIEEFSDELPRTLRANPIVEVPADVLLVNRVMGLMSGIGKTLDSQVNLFTTMMPFTQSLMTQMSEKESAWPRWLTQKWATRPRNPLSMEPRQSRKTTRQHSRVGWLPRQPATILESISQRVKDQRRQ